MNALAGCGCNQVRGEPSPGHCYRFTWKVGVRHFLGLTSAIGATHIHRNLLSSVEGSGLVILNDVQASTRPVTCASDVIGIRGELAIPRCPSSAVALRCIGSSRKMDLARADEE